MSFFKEVAKRITPFMQSKGFSLSGRNYYLISNNIAYCIAFDTPSGLMYVTEYILPLYIPCQCRYYTYGNRLNDIRKIELPLLHKDANAEEIDIWCNLLQRHIEKKIIPYFEKISSAEKLIAYTRRRTHSPTAYLFCHSTEILRLQMFAYLYLGDLVKSANIAARYRDALQKASFFTDSVRQNLIAEITTVEKMTYSTSAEREDYFSQIITASKEIL